MHIIHTFVNNSAECMWNKYVYMHGSLMKQESSLKMTILIDSWNKVWAIHGCNKLTEVKCYCVSLPTVMQCPCMPLWSNGMRNGQCLSSIYWEIIYTLQFASKFDDCSNKMSAVCWVKWDVPSSHFLFLISSFLLSLYPDPPAPNA